MKKYRIGLTALVVLLFWITTSLAAEVESAKISMLYTENLGYHRDEIAMLTRVFKDLTGITISVEYVNYEEQLAKIANSEEVYDVLSFDHVWMIDLIDQDVLQPLDDYVTKQIRADIDPAVIKAFRYDRHTWGMPAFINMQLFFFSKDMLEQAELVDEEENPKKPKDLEQLLEYMVDLKAQGVVEYPWTDAWGLHDGLVADFIWVLAAFDGELFDDDGTPVFDEQPGIEALTFMVTLLKEELAHPRILKYDDVAAKDDLLNEQAAFTSSWLFLEGLLKQKEYKDIQKQLGITLLPTSESSSKRTASVSAFHGLGIAKRSEKQEAAWKWVKFFTSPLVQRAYLGEMPVWESLQDSEDALSRDPAIKLKAAQLKQAHPRPKIAHYSEISAILQRHLHAALSLEIEPAEALKSAKNEIEEFQETVAEDAEKSE